MPPHTAPPSHATPQGTPQCEALSGQGSRRRGSPQLTAALWQRTQAWSADGGGAQQDTRQGVERRAAPAHASCMLRCPGRWWQASAECCCERACPPAVYRWCRPQWRQGCAAVVGRLGCCGAPAALRCQQRRIGAQHPSRRDEPSRWRCGRTGLLAPMRVSDVPAQPASHVRVPA